VTVAGGSEAVADDGPGLPSHERDPLAGAREPISAEHGGGPGLWVVAWPVARVGAPSRCGTASPVDPP